MNYSFNYCRCKYAYWFDDQEFGFSWKKGGKSHSDSISLKKLNCNFEEWVGKPQSTRFKIRLVIGMVVGLFFLAFTVPTWLFYSISAASLLYFSHVVYEEYGFLRNHRHTVICCSDGSDYCYITHDHNSEKERLAFFHALSEAIENVTNKT
jgi:hypothetical protein